MVLWRQFFVISSMADIYFDIPEGQSVSIMGGLPPVSEVTFRSLTEVFPGMPREHEPELLWGRIGIYLENPLTTSDIIDRVVMICADDPSLSTKCKELAVRSDLSDWSLRLLALHLDPDVRVAIVRTHRARLPDDLVSMLVRDPDKWVVRGMLVGGATKISDADIEMLCMSDDHLAREMAEEVRNARQARQDLRGSILVG